MSDLPRVTIQIVSYNGARLLPACLKSIFDQTYRNFQVLVIDNNSQDETVDYLRKNYPDVALFQNNKNLGFARANNQGIKLLHSELVVLCNQDIVLEPDWLENIIDEVEKDKNAKIGSFCGKLLRMNAVDLSMGEVEKTKTIDSCGLKMFKNYQVVELGAGKSDDSYKDIREVFGCSGALVLYRHQALEDCFIKNKSCIRGEYFDETFFMYKEDVDLAWRMRLLGWGALFVPRARAYHIRSLGGSEKTGMWAIIRNRRRQHNLSKYRSYRNHFLMLIKNQFAANLFKNFIPIMAQELKKAIYVLLFEWSSIKAWREAIYYWPSMRKKRKIIFRQIQVDAKAMRKWLK